MPRIAWRDSIMTWPSLQLKFELCPWHWKVRAYKDDLEPYGTVEFGPLEFQWGWNRKSPFLLERVDA